MISGPRSHVGLVGLAAGAASIAVNVALLLNYMREGVDDKLFLLAALASFVMLIVCTVDWRRRRRAGRAVPPETYAAIALTALVTIGTISIIVWVASSLPDYKGYEIRVPDHK